MQHRIKVENKIERIHRENKQRWALQSKLSVNDMLKLKRVKDMVFLDLDKVYTLQEKYISLIENQK